MKKTAFAVAAVALALSAASCSGSDSKNEKKDADAAKKTTAKVDSDKFDPTTNIRYYNMDSVMSNYEMVKTFNEVNLRTMTELQNAETSRSNELQRLASNIQQKMQNNGYLSEASYNADMAEYNQKQQQAQNYLGSLQMKAQEEAARQQQVFLDSINSFLATYNKAHHYDAIIVYSPGDYFNPALDITQEIVDGLNAAYKKSAKADKDAKADSTAVAKK